MKKYLLIMLLLTSICGFSTVYYVDSSKSNNNLDGLSWATAKRDLQNAINAAVTGDEIWVKQGTYYPTTDLSNNTAPTDLRDRCFHFNTKNIKIYGGFIGNETLLNQSDSENNVTYLSGDFSNNDIVDTTGSTISGFDNTDENAYHIFVIASVSATSEISGFTFIGGQTTMSGTATTPYAGYSISKSVGSAISNYSSNIVIKNCKFTRNTALYGTIGLSFNSYNYVINCLFADNYGIWGGAINSQNTARFSCMNTTFFNNRSATAGGIYINSGSNGNTIYNSIFWNNSRNGSTTTGGADISNSGILDVKNTMLQSFTGGTTNNNITGQNPNFVNTNGNDFRLQSGSPGVDSGDNNWVLSTTTTDIAGNARLQNTTVDRGAYEGEVVLSTESFTNQWLVFYPNPVKDFVTIQSKEMIDTINLYNYGGQEIKVEKVDNTINMSNLASGIYMLKVKMTNGVEIIERIIKK